MASPETVDAILIGQSEIVRYDEYSKLPLDRIDYFKELVLLRMVHVNGGFRSHLDVLNYARFGRCYADAGFESRRNMFNIWNLPGFSSFLVASSARHDGFRVAIVNNIDSEWDRFVECYDGQPRPPLVGISTTFHLGYAETRRLCRQLRAHDPRMKIVLGGAFVNEQTINKSPSDFEIPMRKCGVDYVLHAFNSDRDVPALLRFIQGKASVESVPNLAYFDSDTFKLTKQGWNAPTLNDRPVLWKELDLPFVNRTVQLRTASGCPFACAFCTYPETAGGHFTMSLGLIEAQLRQIRDLGHVDRIIFIDDTFNVPTARFRDILRTLCRFDFKWYSFLRAQYVTEEIAQLMHASGCQGVYLGLESASDRVLANMNKKVTRDAYVKGISLLHRYGIPTFAAFVLGFPGETEQTILENIEFLKECPVDFYSTKEFYFMPHAAIHRDRERYGLTGMGNQWKHGTMDSTTASAMKVEMFKEVKGPVFIDPDTSLWYLAYLQDQGLSLSQVKAVQRIINDMMMSEVNRDFGDKSESIRKLRAILVDVAGATEAEPHAAPKGAGSS